MKTPHPITKHGSDTSYRYGCRCERCRTAHTKATRHNSRRWIAATRAAGIVPDRVHGTYTGYSTYDCRCDPCRVAKREYCVR